MKKTIVSILTLSMINVIGVTIGNDVSDVSALTYSDNVGVNFTFSPSLSVSLSSSDIVINNLTPGTSSDSNIVDINVLSNNLSGYSLNATVGNGSTYNNTNLTSISGNTFTSLTPSDSIVDISSFNDNQWGYSYSDQTVSTPTWSDYSGLPLYNTTGATLKTTTGPSAPTGDNTYFKIAAKASPAQASGTYSNVINFTVVGNTNPVSFYDAFKEAQAIDPTITTLNGYYKMQDMDTSICNNVYTSQLADNTDTMEAQLIDTRDNNIYWIAKLKDGHCWMTQNLDLNLDSSVALTSEDTDLTDHSLTGAYADGYTYDANTGVTTWEPAESAETSNVTISGNAVVGWTNTWDGPYSAEGEDIYVYTSDNASSDAVYDSLSDCVSIERTGVACEHYRRGNYYNWAAAVASNNTSDATERYAIAANSICPRSWRLPTALSGDGDNSPTREFGYMLWRMGVLNEVSSGVYTENGLNSIRSKPVYFVRSGAILGGELGALGERGWYWSSTIASIYNAYYANFADSWISTNSVDNKNKGESVRCLAR